MDLPPGHGTGRPRGRHDGFFQKFPITRSDTHGMARRPMKMNTLSGIGFDRQKAPGQNPPTRPCTPTFAARHEGNTLVIVLGYPQQQMKKTNALLDRKSTRLNSSHLGISYA